MSPDISTEAPGRAHPRLVAQGGSLRFDYHISAQGSLTRQGIVHAVRRFLSTLNTALEQDSRHVLG